MAMAVDSRQHPQHFSTMGYPYQQNPAPQFSNPWGTAAPSQAHLYQTALPQANDYKSNVSAYTASQMPASIYGSSAAAAYTSAPAAMSTYAPTSAPQYQSSYGYATDRRTSHPLHNVSEQDRQSFSDALDASRGMVAMSQSDITPRNIYGGASNRSSTDAYGFPGAHSSHSSISSASTYPTYYNSSVSEASTGDYASSNDGNDIMSSRILPRPNTLVGGTLPPAPQSMMGQFSSKVSSSSQKKHKCKVCDKRFTRPSSLQTHMYSHTGEKPFACDVAGCGRNFSVVSNLRRHRKVHKGEGRDHSSPEDDEE